MRKVIFSFLAAVLLALPVATLALGQMTEPIVIEDAQRGESYEQEIFIINNEENVAKIDLVAEGEIGEWVKFYEIGDSENEITSTMIEASNNGKVMAVFSVPEDTANGEYVGVVGVVRKPGETTSGDEDSSGASVSQRIDRNVAITVGGEENAALVVSVIPEKYSIKKGENLNIRFIYDNQGNVSLKPQINLKIRQAEAAAYNAIYPYPDGELAVKPLSRHEIPSLEVPVSNFAKGKYIVEMEFLHNGEVIYEKDFRFSVGSSGMVLGASIAKLKGLWWIGGLILLVIVIMVIVNTVSKLSRKRV